VRWLRPDYQRAWAGVAPEQRAEEAVEQLEAPLIIEAAKARKPAFPTSDLERTLGRVRGVDGSGEAARCPIDRRKVPAGTKNRAFRCPHSGRLCALARHSHVGRSSGLTRAPANLTPCASIPKMTRTARVTATIAAMVASAKA
jgi:hypothetical protein